jgi:hypothetical protein
MLEAKSENFVRPNFLSGDVGLVGETGDTTPG